MIECDRCVQYLKGPVYKRGDQAWLCLGPKGRRAAAMVGAGTLRPLYF